MEREMPDVALLTARAIALADSDGMALLGRFAEKNADPMAAMICLILLAYTVSPDFIRKSADGPDKFSEMCRLVSAKVGALDLTGQ